MKFKDFATGKLVNSSPEEKVRQEYEKILVNDYGYKKSELDIEVSIPRGTGYFPDRADIVVFNSSTKRDPASDILGIVETKRPERKDGLAQLKSYMTATSAIWGVWTNGNDIAYLCKPPGTSSISEHYLNNIPARGQSLKDVGRIKKQDLKPFGREELKIVFRRILRTLYANTNISRKEKLGGEMIKLIFSKIEDEKTYLNRVPEFRSEAGENPKDVKKRIDKLFESVKKELKNDRVFHFHEKITLEAKSVAWVVGQLERGSLLKTDTDVVGDAFEIFGEAGLKGEKGEFFTPRGVIKLAVKLTDPKPEESLCDPACGSGGFLIYAMKHIWSLMEQDPKWKGSPELKEHKQRIASQFIFGIDKESDLVKIAKAYMAISGDGRSNMVYENTLHEIKEFSPFAKEKFIEDNKFRKFDVILTNPPFGSKTKVVRSDSKNFQLGNQWKETEEGKFNKTNKVCEREPHILFIERCLDMLKENGRLAIVLPETIFHAPKTNYIRNFITSQTSIEAVIDLPHNTFRPHCNAKTCLLILKKRKRQNDKVIMAAPKEMGHNHQGKALFRRDTEEIWDDLKVVMRELDNPDLKKNKFTFVVPWSKIKEAGNLVPIYYQSLIKPPKMLQGRFGIRIGDLFDQKVLGAWDGHGSPSSTAKGQGKIPYIRVSDIVNWELYRNPVTGIPRDIYEEMTRNKIKPKPKDILFVRRGSYRIGTVAIVSPQDTEVLLTRELLTFRVLNLKNSYGINPFYLLGLLSSEFVQNQIPSKVFIDTTLPNIGGRWKDIILPVHKNKKEIEDYTARVKSIIDNKWKAQKQIHQMSNDFGDIVT